MRAHSKSDSAAVLYFHVGRFGEYVCSLCNAKLKSEGACRAHRSQLHPDALTTHPTSKRVTFLADMSLHHSVLMQFKNLLQEFPCDWVPLAFDSHTSMLSEEHLTQTLTRLPDDTMPFLLVNGASNLTGIGAPLERLATLIHQHNGVIFADLAACGMHKRPNMNPSPAGALDFAVISPHKYPGAQSAPGLLLAKKCHLTNSVPGVAGGGSVYFVSPFKELYLFHQEQREEAGSLNAVGLIRFGLSLHLLNQLPPQLLMEREKLYVDYFFQFWGRNKRIQVVGPTNFDRVGVLSFMIKYGNDMSAVESSNLSRRGGLYLHHEFVGSVLADLFGIQMRTGCMCAAPYAEHLLGVSAAVVNEMEQCASEGFLVARPGLCRLSVVPYTSWDDVEVIANAVSWVADFGWLLMPFYKVDWDSGRWTSRIFNSDQRRKWLSNYNLSRNAINDFCVSSSRVEKDSVSTEAKKKDPRLVAGLARQPGWQNAAAELKLVLAQGARSKLKPASKRVVVTDKPAVSNELAAALARKKSAGLSVDKPVDLLADTPADEPADLPADELADTPVDKPADLLADTPVDKPADLPAATSVDAGLRDFYQTAARKRAELIKRDSKEEPTGTSQAVGSVEKSPDCDTLPSGEGPAADLPTKLPTAMTHCPESETKTRVLEPANEPPADDTKLSEPSHEAVLMKQRFDSMKVPEGIGELLEAASEVLDWLFDKDRGYSAAQLSAMAKSIPVPARFSHLLWWATPLDTVHSLSLSGWRHLEAIPTVCTDLPLSFFTEPRSREVHSCFDTRPFGPNSVESWNVWPDTLPVVRGAALAPVMHDQSDAGFVHTDMMSDAPSMSESPLPAGEEPQNEVSAPYVVVEPQDDVSAPAVEAPQDVSAAVEAPQDDVSAVIEVPQDDVSAQDVSVRDVSAQDVSAQDVSAPAVEEPPLRPTIPMTLRRKVGSAVRDFGMINNGDKLLLGLSGGKDSLSLLHILLDARKRAPVHFDIGAATVDPMTPEYDPSPLSEYLQTLGVEYHILQQPIVTAAKTHMTGNKESICSFCARMKRGILYSHMRQHGYTTLVLGQHLDDLAESFLMSCFHNGGLNTMKANYVVDAGDLRVIRPLIYCREQLLSDFARKSRLPIIAENCPACFSAPKERQRMKLMLAEQEASFPYLFQNLLKAMKPLYSVSSTLTEECHVTACDIRRVEETTTAGEEDDACGFSESLRV